MEMKVMSEMKTSCPEKLTRIFSRGEELVELAEKGSFRKLQSIMEYLENDDFVPLYFLSRMLKGALIAGHLIIAGYIIEKGYPLADPKVPSALHESLGAVDDSRALDIINFLIAKGLDVNLQVSPGWIAPLHVAVKFGLVECVRRLLEAGADPNAVAKDDLMPLNAVDAITDLETKQRITDLLIAKGARATWRRAVPSPSSVENNPPRFKSFSSLSLSSPSDGALPPLSTTLVSCAPAATPTVSTLSVHPGSSANSSSIAGPRASVQTAVLGSGSVFDWVVDSVVDVLPESVPDPHSHSQPYSAVSDDGGLLFSTST